MTSYFEGYIATIQEQEIPTKYLLNKRARDAERSCHVIINVAYLKQLLKILRGGCTFHTKKLKSEIFNDKKSL